MNGSMLVYQIELRNDTWGRYTFFAQGTNHTEAIRNAMRVAKVGRGGGQWELWSLERLDAALAASEEP